MKSFISHLVLTLGVLFLSACSFEHNQNINPTVEYIKVDENISSYSFGDNIEINSAVADKVFTITKGELASVEVFGASLADDVDGAFLISTVSGCNKVLKKAADKCSVRVKFLKNKTAGNYLAKLVINAGEDSKEVVLSATVVSPEPEVALASLKLYEGSSEIEDMVDFGELSTNQTLGKVLTLKNEGRVDTLPDVSINGHGIGPFSLSSNGCKTVLKPGKTCSIKVQVKGKAELQGSFGVDVLWINQEVSKELSFFNLEPVVVVPDPETISLKLYEGSMERSSLDYGALTVGKNLVKTLSLKNEGTAAVVPNVSLMGEGFSFVQNTCSASLRKGSSCYLKIAFVHAQGATNPQATGSLDISGTSISLSAERVIESTIDHSLLFGSWVLDFGDGSKKTLSITPSSITYNSYSSNQVVEVITSTYVLNSKRFTSLNKTEFKFAPDSPAQATNLNNMNFCGKNDLQAFVLADILGCTFYGGNFPIYSSEDEFCSSKTEYEVRNEGQTLALIYTDVCDFGDGQPQGFSYEQVYQRQLEPVVCDEDHELIEGTCEPLSFIEIDLGQNYSLMASFSSDVNMSLNVVSEASNTIFVQNIPVSTTIIFDQEANLAGFANKFGSKQEVYLNDVLVFYDENINSSNTIWGNRIKVVPGDVLKIIETPLSYDRSFKMQTGVSATRAGNSLYSISSVKIGSNPTSSLLGYHFYFNDFYEKQVSMTFVKNVMMGRLSSTLVEGKTLRLSKLAWSHLGINKSGLIADENVRDYQFTKTLGFTTVLNYRPNSGTHYSGPWSTILDFEVGEFTNNPQDRFDFMIYLRDDLEGEPFSLSRVIRIPVVSP